MVCTLHRPPPSCGVLETSRETASWSFLPMLKVRHVWLASLVRQSVLFAPFRRDPPEVAARILALATVSNARWQGTEHVPRYNRTSLMGNSNWSLLGVIKKLKERRKYIKSRAFRSARKHSEGDGDNVEATTVGEEAREDAAGDRGSVEIREEDVRGRRA